MEERKYRAPLKRLYDARLVLTADPARPLDCHPLVREHFAAQAAHEGHARLYEYYKKQAPQLPDTLEEMTPLFYAVYHGCQAGQHQAALDEVYYSRIDRGGVDFLDKKLGAFGTNLSLLANFFERPWTRPVAALSPAVKPWLINCAGLVLCSLGRLADAVAPMQAGTAARVRSENWLNAGLSYGNLSLLHLNLGNLPEAVATARDAVVFADRSRNWSPRVTMRAALAHALHQAGDLAEAQRVFVDAERLHVESQPGYPFLYSLQGYRYCDLLLEQGHTEEVLRRVARALPVAESQGWLLDIGLDHLSLARALPAGSAESASHFDQAVDFLRQSGQVDHLPRALLARGAPQDLDEAFRIATRSGMRLYLADYHLIMSRNALAAGNYPQAREHFAMAETLIQASGYHRRDPGLAQLRTELQGKPLAQRTQIGNELI
jgi:hypothetical protein